MDNRRIGERIKTARKKKGMSQEMLAEKLGVSFQAVSSWETGRFVPDAEHLPALAKELGLSLDALFAEEEKKMEKDWELKPVNGVPEKMYTFVKGRAQTLNLPQTLAALPLMREKHRKTGKMRKSRHGFEVPYEAHPLTMACHALAMGLRDDDVLAACLLHDVVEDTGTSPADLEKELPMLNEQVLKAVELVSKNLYDRTKKDWEEEYFRKIRENPLACLVKCLDRVNNLSGMADGFDEAGMIRYTKETDKYYPALLEIVGKVPEWNDARWLLRYQMTALEETFKRLL